ncbi:MAG TPA: T9SS type A sorting domain-containing protein, partial [Bacteroidia bacterium]|nr:T9SS type A sorting domain-containing protein [Bacteroidia bacterium]
GNFNTVNGAAGFNNIAMYNGVSWSNMAGGCFGDIFNPALSVSANATVYSIAVMGNMVYAGGQFTNAGAAGGVNNIAQYNTGSGIWSAMSTGGTSGATGAYDAFTAGGHYTGWTQEPCVFALAADAANNILYAGGNFTTIGSTTCTNIGQWNALTSTWSAVGTGMTQGNQDGAQVYSLLVYNGGLLAGGDFKIATPMYAPYLHAYFIAYWDYNDWTAFSTPVGTANKEGFADDVQAMAVSAGGTLFAGGIFVNSGGGGKVNYIAQFTGVSTLPVELINFDVRFDPLTKSVDLVWTTASETNNRSFTIERTKDGDVWEPVNTVSGAGNSSTTLSYRDQDKKPLPGISYYRLKQTDYNGESTLSRSVAVNSKDQLDELRLYPNPATTQAMLSFLAPNSGEAEIQICDCTGRSVQITRHWVTEGLNTLSLDLVSLDKGLYIVNISGAQLLLTSKLILTNTHSQ